MKNGLSAAISTIAGFLVVLAAILALTALALIGIYELPSADKAKNILSIITGVGGVIGTMVGAYFGVKLGTAGSQESATRAIEMAALADPQAARAVLEAEATRPDVTRARPQSA